MQRLFRSTPRQSAVGLLILRLWVGIVLAVGHGIGKGLDLPKFIEGVAARGFPLPMVLGPFAAVSELLGGILLAVGLFSRVAAAAIVATMLGAAFVAHAADPFARKELALAYAVAALVVLIAGPGPFSIDGLLVRKKRRG